MRRDRRSTGLSISTLSSSSNASSPVVVSSIEDAHDPEKGHFLLLPPRLEQDDGLPSPYLKAAQQEAARRPWHRRLAGSVTRTRILLAAIVFTLFLHRSVLTITAVQNLRAGSTLYSVKEGTVLDVEPDAILIQDEHGHTKWAVSIPGDAPFPLRQYQYRQLCASAWSLTRRLHSDMSWATGYYARDKRYLDVLDAEHAGVFTNISSQPPIPVVGLARAGSNLPTCARSMVFIMDTEDAGFGTSLLSLWLAYGLAKREKRAFFINDHGWQYGTYSTYFPLPPLPGCAPPPASTVVPCPHQAAHLAVTAATIRETFGGQFHAHFTKAISPRGIFSRSHDPIYDMTRTGYEALYGLAGEDAAFARARIQELRDQARSAQRPVVGMHIRRGDRHPFEYEFQNDYLPLERYTAAATTLLNTIRTTTHSDSAHNASTAAPPLLVASDDPDIITSPDLAPGPSTPSPAMGGSERPLRLERVQSRIVLASKRTLQPTPAAPDDGSSAFVKHVDEVSGWEGGFFAGLFRGLGRDPASRRYPSFESAAVLRTTQVETAALRGAGADSGSSNAEAASWLRELVGRAYVLDLGVLAGGSDGVVCAVSSATCRVLGVMMGRDKVRAGKGWVNVDDGRGWSWDGLH